MEMPVHRLYPEDAHADDAARAAPVSRPQGGDALDALKALHDALRRCLDHLRRSGAPVPSDLRARLAACEADLMDARFDNMPV